MEGSYPRGTRDDESLDRGLVAATPRLMGRERIADVLRTWPQHRLYAERDLDVLKSRGRS